MAAWKSEISLRVSYFLFQRQEKEISRFHINTDEMPTISLFCGESRGLFWSHSNGDRFNIIFACEAIMFFAR